MSDVPNYRLLARHTLGSADKWEDEVMADSWTTMTAADVQVGDRLRLATGSELTVSRIEPEFLGMDGLVAFIEDTSERWFKQPMPMAAQVEVSRA